MKRFYPYLTILLLAALVAFVGCTADQPNEPSPTVDSGSADFSRVAVLGASFEAGFEDGYLTGEKQLRGYATLIAEQMGLTVGTTATDDFVIPYVSPGAGTKLELTGFDTSGNPIISRTDMQGLPTNLTHPRPYNNLGIPGALVGEVLQTTSSATSISGNPMFDLILRNDPEGNPAEQLSAVGQAIALNPTFVILGEMGNDVLGAATSGMTTPGLPVPVAQYSAAYGGIVGSLKTALPNVDLVGINIPYVTSLPYFTTVGWKVEVPGVGEVPLVIETGAGGVRQATANDLILLPASTVIGDVSGDYGPAGIPVGLDAAAPLPNSLVLDQVEAGEIEAVVDSYNDAISAVAQQNGFPVFDGNALMEEIASHGYEIAGIEFSEAFITGGLFSLDGIHLTDPGDIILANHMIETINNYYDSNIPPVSMTKFD